MFSGVYDFDNRCCQPEFTIHKLFETVLSLCFIKRKEVQMSSPKQILSNLAALSKFAGVNF